MAPVATATKGHIQTVGKCTAMSGADARYRSGASCCTMLGIPATAIVTVARMVPRKSSPAPTSSSALMPQISASPSISAYASSLSERPSRKTSPITVSEARMLRQKGIATAASGSVQREVSRRNAAGSSGAPRCAATSCRSTSMFRRLKLHPKVKNGMQAPSGGQSQRESHHDAGGEHLEMTGTADLVRMIRRRSNGGGK